MLKLLDLSVGSAPLVAFVVVASFLLGTGLGALWSARVARPYFAELALAAYDLTWVFALDPLLALNGRSLAVLVPLLGPNAACAVLGAAYALPPAFLLGISFPAVAERSRDPAWAYGRQALGALVGVILIELLAFPVVGVPGSLALLALVHAAAALLMYRMSFELKTYPLGRPPMILLVAGTFTGLTQGSWLLLACLLFTPHWTIQPTVIATMILGISLGTKLWRRFRLSTWLTFTVASVGVSTSLFFAIGVAHLPQPRALPVAISQLVIALLPAAVPIGAIFPAFTERLGENRSPIGGGLLALSIGNTLGVLAAGAVTLRHTSAPMSVAIAATGLAVIAAIGRSRSAIAAVICALGVFVTAGLAADDRVFISRFHRGAPIRIERLHRGGGEVSAIYVAEEAAPQRLLYQNGFTPLDLDRAAEARIAYVSAAYSPKADRALVLGAGSGQTAGAIARAFGHTDVVDIGETVPDLLRDLRKENYELWASPRVTYHSFDAIIAPHLLSPGFDLIVLTVDPAFVATASKLYTREYFAELARLMPRDGVFVFWAGAAAGAEGVQVLWNTAAAVFPEQRRFLAFAGPSRRTEVGYHFVISSALALRFDPTRPAAVAIARLDEASRRGAELLKDERMQLLAPGRLHETKRTHSRARPAPSIVLGGYSRIIPQISVD
ncbi:MAG: hypothetical protein HY791_20230 [Deltaproteobacteria bacterium]|nr:hypothetical protein [Deltaproteobacteria bacterium]